MKRFLHSFLIDETLSSTTFYCHGTVPKLTFVKFMLERKYMDTWISRADKARALPWGETSSGQTNLEFILDVIRKLTSRKFKMQTYYAILDVLLNELRKRRAANGDFYQKLEVFLQSADMSRTEIVDCTKRLI